MEIKVEDKHKEIVHFEVDEDFNKYYVVLKSGKIVDATNNIPFLRLLDLIDCPTELPDFETKLGISWNADKEIVVV